METLKQNKKKGGGGDSVDTFNEYIMDVYEDFREYLDEGTIYAV